MNPCNHTALSTLEWQGKFTRWRLTSIRRELRIDTLRNADFIIAVSLRNRRFSNKWLHAVIAEIVALDGHLRLCLVDAPYFDRIMLREKYLDRFGRGIVAFRKECEQQKVRLDRIAKQFPNHVDVFSWCDVERLMPLPLSSELEAAFQKKSRVYQALIHQVQTATDGAVPLEEADPASVFLQREFPVLLYMYYSLFPTYIDTYPGPQANFFWDLERGVFEEELPIATELARTGVGHAYAEVSVAG